MTEEPQTIPLLPLPFGSVLLPASTLKIPLSARSDIPSILTSLAPRDGSSRPLSENVRLGCVPLNSGLLGSDGSPLALDERRHFAGDEHSNPSRVDHRQLFMFGVTATVSGVQGGDAEEFALTVVGHARFRIDRFVQMRPHYVAEISHVDGPESPNPDGGLQFADIASSFGNLKELSLEWLELVRINSYRPLSSITLSPFLARQFAAYITNKEVNEAGILADFMASLAARSLEDKLRVLAQTDLYERLELVADLIATQIDALRNQHKVTIMTTKLSSNRNAKRRPDQKNREMVLRRALKDLGGLGAPLPRPSQGDDDQEVNEIEEIKQKIDEAQMTPEALQVAEKELKRLRKINPAQAEYGVCRTYIETLTELPWIRSVEHELGPETLRKARVQLDDDHYGLEKIKKRLLEYLAVLKLKQSANKVIDEEMLPGSTVKTDISNTNRSDTSKPPGMADQRHDLRILHAKRKDDRGPILLLVGPPGTGKTSLAKSIAVALGRKFYRLSLGGVRDEAEIRGHRRTYVAAMPGLIINGLRKVGVNNPVFLLDEIDKVGGSSIHGDPAAAMLEVLDPEQNHTFSDHYVNIPFDLSKVLFIATANTLETISSPLLDRMETIGLSGYTTIEKRHIARRHLLPKQIASNGLEADLVHIPDDVLDVIITAYTREAGVRNLEREIGSVCRSKAVQYTDAQDGSTGSGYQGQVTIEDLEEILGIERFENEITEKEATPGVVTGLVAFGSSGQGSILFIEVVDMPGNGKVQLTGKLGEVLVESVEVALTWVKAHAFELGLTSETTEDIMRQRDIHVHCPSGAIPKDGPSAGIGHAIALISLFSQHPIAPDLAMTGEISLRGRVMPVGGIKEKLIGAHRAGVKKVLLPVMNRKDLRDVPQEVKDSVEIVHIGHVWEAIAQVWPHWSGKQHTTIESRL